VNAAELLTALAAIPDARSVTVSAEGIAESCIVAGIEVARATDGSERTLRRLWRARSRGGPDPLLLVVDDPEDEGVVRTLGPLTHDGPIHSVTADGLLRLVERVAALPRLQAVRTLAEELDRLDHTGAPGLVVRGLGTEHLYAKRLRNSTRWARLEEAATGLEGDWREILRRLGYELEELLPRGYLARAHGEPVLVVWPVADPRAFAKLDAEGRPPEGLVVNECLRTGAPYGLLTAGPRLRLLEARPASGSAVGRYLELDASALSDEHRPLLGLLAPDVLATGELTALLDEARRFGVELRKRLDLAIRQEVLPPLGRELGRWARSQGRDLVDDDVRHELEAAALTFVFRALFVLYAESAGHLPTQRESYRPHALSQLVQEAAAGSGGMIWRRIQTLVEALRDGEPGWAVPGYNGDLFAPDGFEGAEVLEQASLPDEAIGPALVALGLDPETGGGYDFSDLGIGHLGHIYEGLLSLRLSLADRDYRYDARSDRYVAAEGDEVEIHEGELLWLTDEGGRKGGGVYYTPEPLVRHLVRRGVVPAFERHLESVAELVRTDPAAAAQKLFAFRVLDPACGSAHFLVAVVDELADLVARFLARHPLPAVRAELDDLRAGAGETYGVGVEDVALLRRLVLKRCVYGVDLSPMGAEIAKISLWLASFVPGLSLSYLDHNVRVGNSLVGVADLEAAEDFAGDVLRQALARGAELTGELREIQDRTPDEVERSKAVEAEIRSAVDAARSELDAWVGRGDAFHWPLEFPEAFAGGGGFDAVVGNPPWEEITVEELAFYARYQPGLRGLSAEPRTEALAELKQARPELAERYRAELEESATLRRYFAADPGYSGSPGDPDLYKFFCQRYRRLLADGASLAVVLPRSAFGAKGSTDFREWLFGSSTVRRLDFLVNTGRWAFDAEPRYTSALLIATAETPGDDHLIEVAGVADSAAAFAAQSASDGIRLAKAALGRFLEVPLVPSQAAAALLAKVRAGRPFPVGCRRWRCFPVAEFHETNDKALWADATEGRPLWKGESFDQYDPRGAEARACPASEAALAKQRKPNPGKDSLVAAQVPRSERAAAVREEVQRARVAFRDVSRATDSRTIRACLVPPETFLLNSAPYLTFVDGSDLDRACCLGLMNSLVFDWQARRFVETHVNFFVLEGLRLPELTDERYEGIARAAARLSCPDERFAGFAEGAGVEHGSLANDEHHELRAEIDALVAHAYGLSADDLELVFSDFTLDAVPEDYRELVRRRFAELR
jgi:hypothetical protein